MTTHRVALKFVRHIWAVLDAITSSFTKDASSIVTCVFVFLKNIKKYSLYFKKLAPKLVNNGLRGHLSNKFECLENSSQYFNHVLYIFTPYLMTSGKRKSNILGLKYVTFWFIVYLPFISSDWVSKSTCSICNRC